MYMYEILTSYSFVRWGGGGGGGASPFGQVSARYCPAYGQVRGRYFISCIHLCTFLRQKRKCYSTHVVHTESSKISLLQALAALCPVRQTHHALGSIVYLLHLQLLGPLQLAQAQQLLRRLQWVCAGLRVHGCGPHTPSRTRLGHALPVHNECHHTRAADDKTSNTGFMTKRS